MKRRESKIEHSAGGVVYRQVNKRFEVVLFWSSLQQEETWSLPKGWLDGGETEKQAAVREVREETGIIAKIEQKVDTIHYTFQWEGKLISKTVDYYLMRAVGGSADDHDFEAQEVRWFPLEEAEERLAYKNEKDVMKKAKELLQAKTQNLKAKS